MNERELKKRETLRRLQTPPEPSPFATGEYIEQPIGPGYAFGTAGTFTLSTQPLGIEPVGTGEYVDEPVHQPWRRTR